MYLLQKKFRGQIADTIHLIVPDHLGGVLAKTSENACVGDLATEFVSATGTPGGSDFLWF